MVSREISETLATRLIARHALISENIIKDGVLKVVLPKSEEAKTKEIKIKVD